MLFLKAQSQLSDARLISYNGPSNDANNALTVLCAAIHGVLPDAKISHGSWAAVAYLDNRNAKYKLQNNVKPVCHGSTNNLKLS